MKDEANEEPTLMEKMKLLQLGVAQIFIFLICMGAIIVETWFKNIILIYINKISEYGFQSVLIILYSYDKEDIKTLKKWFCCTKEEESHLEEKALEDQEQDYDDI